MLEAKADKDRQCIKDTAVHLAARNGHLEVMRLLLQARARMDQVTKEKGETFLHDLWQHMPTAKLQQTEDEPRNY